MDFRTAVRNNFISNLLWTRPTSPSGGFWFKSEDGKVGALTGKNALTAKVGETLLIVHSANRDSRPHLIGGHGDYVWETGKFSNPPQTGLDLVHPRRFRQGCALHVLRARRLRLRHPQPDRGRRTRRRARKRTRDQGSSR